MSSPIDLKAKPFYLTDEDIAWVEETLGAMTLEQKVGQLFCLMAKQGTKEELDDIFHIMEPGCVMYRPMPLEQTISCTRMIQTRAKIPMLISANVEKGADGAAVEATLLGSPLQIAATGDPLHAERLGIVCGEEASAMGVNWAFSPIIDIDFNFRNPITNTRTFGSNVDNVEAMGKVFVEAVQAHGMAASIKHFPGDGCDERDQHLLSSVNDLSCKAWNDSYGRVYRTCIDAGAKTVMVGHILQPEWTRKLNPGIRDADILPGSLSKEIMQGLLRGELGFNGLICTDSSVMVGFAVPMARKDALPLAIASGADMIVFSRNIEEDYGYMLDATKTGVISLSRLDEAVLRILGLKASLGLHKDRRIPSGRTVNVLPNRQLHLQWAKECADQAITLVKEQPGILPLTPKKYKRVLYCPIEGEAGIAFSAKEGVCDHVRTMLKQEGFEITTFVPENQFEGKVSPTTAITQQYDLVLYVANLATKSNQTTVRIEWQQPMGANCPQYINVVPTVFVSVENPYHLLDVPRIKTYINTYCSSDTVLEALVEKLMGRSEFKGTNPVDPFCGKWDTHL